MSTVDTRLSRVDRRLSFGQMGVHANISSIVLTVSVGLSSCISPVFAHHSKQFSQLHVDVLFEKLLFQLSFMP